MTTKDLTIKANLIREKVRAALQEAEEIGGVHDTTDYLCLMESILEDVTERIANCEAAIKDREDDYCSP